MKLLDLFCGAGGAAMGYYRAGFTEIVGVDVSPQPRYPFTFVQADALDYLRTVSKRGCAFDAVHASPPCQRYTVANNIHQRPDHPDLIAPTRRALQGLCRPYVIENVPRAPLHRPVCVCGRALGCGVKRHRLFESNVPLVGTVCPKGHPGDWVCVFGHTVLERSPAVGRTLKNGPMYRRKHLGTDHGRAAMGIPWMSREELSEAIPPAYSEYIGRQVRQYCTTRPSYVLGASPLPLPPPFV